MIEHEGLVVVDFADGVLAEVWIKKGNHLKILKVLELHHLVDVANFVPAKVKILDLVKLLDVIADILDRIHSKIQVGHFFKSVKIIDSY
jgi:hypothetical protein